MADSAIEAGFDPVCKSCSQSKPATLEFWPNAKGQPDVSGMCRLCNRTYKRLFDKRAKGARVAARTQGVASLTDTAVAPAKGGAVSTSRDKLPGELPLRQLEVVQALRAGAQYLNEQARTILDTLFIYVADPTHPHHEWALKLVAERLMPRKLYEDLGAKDAGILAGEGGQRPSVTIIVQPAAAPAPVESPVVTVIDGESKRV